MIPNDEEAFVQRVAASTDLVELRRMATEVMALADAEKRLRYLLMGNQINPFFVQRPQRSGQPQMSGVQYLNFISLARIAAANSSTPRIIVSAPMKSGSTFLSDSLSVAFDLPKASLIMLLARPYDYGLIGAATRAHEIDEAALLWSCMIPEGFVSHHHMIATPFLARQAEVYGLKFVLMKRNIFDCIVSLDDYSLKELKGLDDPAERYFALQLPPGWVEMDFEDRIHHLLDKFLATYVQYHVSWISVERKGLIKPFWISYENDILAGTQGLADRICDWLNRPADGASLIASLQRDASLSKLQFNRGVAGRGNAIQGKNRSRVQKAFGDFKELADWSEILG